MTDASSVIHKLTRCSELMLLFNADEISKLRKHSVEEAMDVTTTPVEDGRHH